MENKKTGELIIAISTLIAIVFGIFSISTLLSFGKSILLTIQSILGLLIFLSTITLGFKIRNRKEKQFVDIPEIKIVKFEKDSEEIDTTESTENKKEKSIENLNSEEEKIIKILKKEKEILQSELMKEIKVNKVKMTRLLKKLEEKDLIFKKKVGMNNVVVLN